MRISLKIKIGNRSHVNFWGAVSEDSTFITWRCLQCVSCMSVKKNHLLRITSTSYNNNPVVIWAIFSTINFKCAFPSFNIDTMCFLLLRNDSDFCWFSFVLWCGIAYCLFNLLCYFIWWFHPSSKPRNYHNIDYAVHLLINSNDSDLDRFGSF